MDVDTSSVEVDVCLGQAIEFTDTQPSPQQDHNIIIVVVLTMISDELQVPLLLGFGQCASYISIIGDHIGQLELEWVFPNHIIIDCHFKGWPENTLQNADRVLLQALVMQRNEPPFPIRQADAAYHSASKRIRMDAIDSGAIGSHGVFFQPST